MRDAAEGLAEVGEGVILGQERSELAGLGAAQRDDPRALERPVEDEREITAARRHGAGGGCCGTQTLGVFTPQTDHLTAYIELHHRRTRDRRGAVGRHRWCRPTGRAGVR